MKMLFICVMLLGAVTGWCAELDGTAWSVQLTPSARAARAGEKAFEETLIFASGNLVGKEWVSRGFAAQGYSTSAEGKDVTGFTSEQQSVTGQGSAKWSGTAQGELIQGTLRWKRADGKILLFTFKGKKQ